MNGISLAKRLVLDHLDNQSWFHQMTIETERAAVVADMVAEVERNLEVASEIQRLASIPVDPEEAQIICDEIRMRPWD